MDSSLLMTNVCNDIIKPLASWRHWPCGLLKPGDIIRIDWSYEGTFGFIEKESTFLLVDCVTKEDDAECWKCLMMSTVTNGEKCNTTKMSEHTLRYFGDSSDDENWQMINLLARSNDETTQL